MMCPGVYMQQYQTSRTRIITGKKEQVMSGRREFKIGLLEDNRFYNSLMRRQMERYTDEIAAERDIDFRIYAYTSPHDFLRNIPEDTNMAIVDYYLGEDVNGIYVLNAIFKKCSGCKVFIISNTGTIKTSLVTILEGASGFILKDRHALSNACYAVEDIMKSQGYL
ncbi:MAG: response regulator receiver [Bacteroidetes bacterium]|nr:MAG: response regulator receiver [Bacteroidota bacterium]